MKRKLSLRKKIVVAFAVLLSLLVLLTGAFFCYVSDYYPAEELAITILNQGERLDVQDD